MALPIWNNQDFILQSIYGDQRIGNKGKKAKKLEERIAISNVRIQEMLEPRIANRATNARHGSNASGALNSRSVRETAFLINHVQPYEHIILFNTFPCDTSTVLFITSKDTLTAATQAICGSNNSGALDSRSVRVIPCPPNHVHSYQHGKNPAARVAPRRSCYTTCASKYASDYSCALIPRSTHDTPGLINHVQSCQHGTEHFE